MNISIGLTNLPQRYNFTEWKLCKYDDPTDWKVIKITKEDLATLKAQKV